MEIKEDFKRGVQAHHKAHRHYHFQVTVFVAGILAADLGKKIRAAPTE